MYGITRTKPDFTPMLAVAFSLVAGFSSTASATESCSALKNSVNARGSHTYHYKDRSHPTLDLYVQYVIASPQCNTGKEFASRAVPALQNCCIPT